MNTKWLPLCLQTFSKSNPKTSILLEQRKTACFLSGKDEERQIRGILFGTSICEYRKSQWHLKNLQPLLLLSFSQDVSDRIEKESEESDLLMSLQKDSIPVVRGDWKVHLSSELQEGEYRERDWEPMVLKAFLSACGLSIWRKPKNN